MYIHALGIPTNHIPLHVHVHISTTPVPLHVHTCWYSTYTHYPLHVHVITCTCTCPTQITFHCTKVTFKLDAFADSYYISGYNLFFTG